MSIFHDWLVKRMREGLGDGGDPVDGFELNRDQDFAGDHEHLQQELFKTVLSKYPDETMQFLNGIAQRGDQEIAALLSKLGRDKKPSFSQPKHPSEGDEVVPASADTGYNNEFGDA